MIRLTAWMTAAVGLTAAFTGRISAPQLAQMQHHFDQIVLVRDAVIRGDLPSAQMSALPLTRLSTPSTMPAAAGPFMDALREEARKVATAASLDVAARATASMLTQCGECHNASSVYVNPATARKPDVGGIVGHMLEHQRGADQLLLGLIVPSPSIWREGAERLSGDTLDPSMLPKDPKLVNEVRKADVRLHELARDAQRAVEPDARTTSYAQLLTTCAACHGAHSRIWGPGRGGH